MVIAAMIILTALGILFFFLWVVTKIWGESNDLLLFLGIVTIALSLTISICYHREGAGQPYSLRQLADNQIYERVGDGGIKNSHGSYIVLVKSQDGKERCFELAKVPPKFSKVISGPNGTREIVPYPPNQ